MMIISRSSTIDDSENQSANALTSSDAPTDSPLERIPTDFPDFSKPQTSPILYLPPLLSSLPHNISHTPAPSPAHQPITTDSCLPEIDAPSLSLHRAFHDFTPITPHYATRPYAESFNWDTFKLPEDQEREWYAVVFRSKRKPGSDSGRKAKFIPDRDQ
jgi:hypothetical protein